MECNTIGERIVHLRKVKGISQGDLAKALFVKREVVAYWEEGRRDLKTDYTIKLADYFGVTCDYLLRGIQSENVDIARATGLNDKSIEHIKMTAQLTTDYHHESLGVAVNRFFSSSNFLWFISSYMQYLNKSNELKGRLKIFREWLIEHEVKPPKKLLEYASEVALENKTSPAMDVMQCKAELKYLLFALHNSLDEYVTDIQQEVESDGINP